MAERRRTQNMYPVQQGGSPFAIGYQPMYDPALDDRYLQAFQYGQGRHDQITAGMNEQLAQIGSMETSDPDVIGGALESYRERLDKIAKDYNYNYSQATSALTREMAKEASNPLYQLNRHKVEQIKREQQLVDTFGPDAILRGGSVRDRALTPDARPEDYVADVVKASDTLKVAQIMGNDLKATIQNLGLSRHPEFGQFMQYGSIKELTPTQIAEFASHPAVIAAFRANAPTVEFDNREGYDWSDEGIANYLYGNWAGKATREENIKYMGNPAFGRTGAPKRIDDGVYLDTYTGVGETATNRGIRRINKDADKLRSQTQFIKTPGSKLSIIEEKINNVKSVVAPLLRVASEEKLQPTIEKLQKEKRKGKGRGIAPIIFSRYGTSTNENNLEETNPVEFQRTLGIIDDYLKATNEDYLEADPSQRAININEEGLYTVPHRNKGYVADVLSRILTEKDTEPAEKSYNEFFEDKPLIQQEVSNGNMTLDEAINFGQQTDLDKYMTFSTSTEIPDPNSREKLVRAVRTNYLGSDNIEGEAFLVSPNRKGNLEEEELTRTKVGSLLGEKGREVFNVTVTPYDSRGNTMLEFHTTNKDGVDEIIRVPGKTGSNETKTLVETLNNVMEGIYGHNSDRTVVELPDQRRVLIHKQFIREPHVNEQGLEIPGYYDTKVFIEIPYVYEDGTIEMRPERVNPSDISEEVISAIMKRTGQRPQQKPTNY